MAKGYTPADDIVRNQAHKIWNLGKGAANKYKSASLSEITVIFCAQGEHLQWPDTSSGTQTIGRANFNSHRTSRGGGTDAIFADSHVEWVAGTRIGLP